MFTNVVSCLILIYVLCLILQIRNCILLGGSIVLFWRGLLFLWVQSESQVGSSVVAAGFHFHWRNYSLCGGGGGGGAIIIIIIVKADNCRVVVVHLFFCDTFLLIYDVAFCRKCISSRREKRGGWLCWDGMRWHTKELGK